MAPWLALAASALGLPGAGAARTWEATRRPRAAAWELLSEDVVRQVLGHVQAMPQISPDLVWYLMHLVPQQPRLAWSTRRPQLRLVSLGEDGRQMWERHMGSEIFAVEFLSGGDVVASATATAEAGEVALWNTRTGMHLRTLRHPLLGAEGGQAPPGGGPVIFDMRALPEADQVVTLCGGVVIVWNATAGSVLHRLRAGPPSLSSVRVLRGGAKIAMGVPADLEDRLAAESVVVWDVASGARHHPQVWGALGLEASPCGEKLAVLMSDGAISVWNAVDLQVVQQLFGFPQGCYRHSLAISAGGCRVAAGGTVGHGGRFVLWDGLAGGNLASRSEGGGDTWQRVAFFPAGDRLVLGMELSVFILNATSGRQLLELSPVPSLGLWPADLRRVAASPCGRFVAACGEGLGAWPWLALWDAASGRRVLHEQRVGVEHEHAEVLHECSIAIGPPRSTAEVLAF